VMRYLLDNPQVFESLPDNFELVILSENDPEMGAYNLSLLDKFGSASKEVVLARVGESRPTIDVINDIKSFRHEHRLDGESLREMIEEGRE
ncbi:MAG: hypothetical protein DRP02_13920, partial [Candidatus Gerdarchaeota archaeon]